MIFLFVYSRIRHALRSGGYRDGFAALRLQNLLVFCPRGEVAQRAEGGIPVRSQFLPIIPEYCHREQTKFA